MNRITTRHTSNAAGRGGIRATYKGKSFTWPYDHSQNAAMNHWEAAQGLASKLGLGTLPKEASGDAKRRGQYVGLYWNVRRESNPGPRSIHTAKWDRCVKDVSARGGAKSAAAVCTATIGYEGSVKKGHRSHNPTWHQRKGMKRRGPPKFEPGWYIADDTGGFLSYIGPMKTEKEARELLEVRAKNGATGNVFHVPARSENPLPSVRKVYYIICAVKGAEKYYLARSGKLTRAQAGAARFATAQAAIDKAKAHLKNYAASRKYRFDLKLAY